MGRAKKDGTTPAKRAEARSDSADSLELFESLPPPVIISLPGQGRRRSVRWENRLNDLAVVSVDDHLDWLRPSTGFEWFSVAYAVRRFRFPLSLPIDDWGGAAFAIPTRSGVTIVGSNAEADVDLANDFWLPKWRHRVAIDEQRRARLHSDIIVHLGLRFTDQILGAVDKRRPGVTALHLVAPNGPAQHSSWGQVRGWAARNDQMARLASSFGYGSPT
ncbi:MAG: hypothetical protein WCO36_07485 [Actinomycetes bacterium]